MVKAVPPTCAPFTGCVFSLSLVSPFYLLHIFSCQSSSFSYHSCYFLVALSHTCLQLATFPTPSGTFSVCAFVLTDSSPLRTLSRSWEKGPDWVALLLVPGHRAQVAELIGCTSFRCLALGDEIGSKYGCLEKTLQTQLFIGSRQLSYISEQMRLVVKGKYTFACQAEDRIGCCLKA